MGRIISLGKLGDTRWPGHVSAAGARLPIHGILAHLDGYYVSAAPDAPTRCIDGRHDPELDEQHLGAQVPGGAPGAALAHRLGVDKDDLTRGTFVNDAESMINAYLRLELSPGGHRDDADHADTHIVGCGALDGIDLVLRCLTNPELVEDHKRLVRSVLDSDFNRDHYLRILGAAMVLQSRAQDYFAGRGTILDILEAKAPGSVSTLHGLHREALFVVNLVPGTTFSSNRFAHDNDGIQAFGYDLWRSRQLAATLFPLASQHIDRERFVTARVMITFATLMALTDGSQRLLLRLSN